MFTFTILRVQSLELELTFCYCYFRYGLLCRKSNKAAFDQQLQASSDKLSVVSVVVTVVIMLLVICGFLLLLYYFYYPMGKPGLYVCTMFSNITLSVS